MPSKVTNDEATATAKSTAEESAPVVKTKKEMQAEARKKAREAIYKTATSPRRPTSPKTLEYPKKSFSTTPKKSGSTTPKNPRSTTPKKSKHEQLERARAYGENLKKKNASPLPAPRTPVSDVFIDSGAEMHEVASAASSSEFESAKETDSTTYSSKKLDAAVIEELKRLRDEAEAHAAEAGSTRDHAEARRVCLQDIIDENERVDCD